MRILFITGSLVHGGAERHSITLLNRLAERGHECHAVFVKNDPSQLGRLHPGRGGTVECLDAGRFFDRRALGNLAAHLVALQPSVIVAANDYATMYALLSRWIAGLATPVIATFHTTKVLGIREHAKTPIARCCFLAADCLVFVSERQRLYWRRRALTGRRVEVIHNGVDADHFRAGRTVETASCRRACGFAADDFVIGLSAVLRPEKNHLQLLDAVAALRAAGIPAKALLIGDGPMRQAVEARIQALGIGDATFITGFQDDVRPYLAACDALVLCSTAVETFSLAALEAMAMGKPVVHSDIGGAQELIADGHNGYLFPVGDTAALVHCLVRLADPARTRPMGMNARRAVEARFSEAAMIDRYERLLTEIGRPTRAACGARHDEEPAWPGIDNPCDTRSPST
jgi:glycosyltransferase involved in cell wall biosynthesis